MAVGYKGKCPKQSSEGSYSIDGLDSGMFQPKGEPTKDNIRPGDAGGGLSNGPAGKVLGAFVGSVPAKLNSSERGTGGSFDFMTQSRVPVIKGGD